MDPLVRRRAKAINFGIIYGISRLRPRQPARHPARARRATTSQAYFERYPGIRDYMERTKDVCARARLCRDAVRPADATCPASTTRTRRVRAFAERAAINAPLQGGAADIIKRAMIRMPAALGDGEARGAHAAAGARRAGVRGARRRGRGDRGGRQGRSWRPPAALLSVPLVVETGVGANWGTAH